MLIWQRTAYKQCYVNILNVDYVPNYNCCGNRYRWLRQKVMILNTPVLASDRVNIVIKRKCLVHKNFFKSWKNRLDQRLNSIRIQCDFELILTHIFKSLGSRLTNKDKQQIYVHNFGLQPPCLTSRNVYW